MITFPAKVNTGLNGNFKMTWVVQALFDLGTRYWASMPCTISGQAYDGVYISFGGVGEIETSVNILDGGNFAAVGNCSLTLNEIATVAGVHSEIAPQEITEEIANREVKIGVIYNDGGVLATTDIAWLYDGVIEDWSSVRQSLELQIIGIREIEKLILPKVVLDDVTYPYAPKEAIGKPIPILYGDWGETDIGLHGISEQFVYETLMCFPTVCINKLENIFLCSGHEVHTMQRAYHRTSDMRNYAEILIGTAVDTFVNCTLDATTGKITVVSGTIIGSFRCLFASAAYTNDATDFQNSIDGDSTTYSVLAFGANEILALVTSGLPSGKITNDDVFVLPLYLTIHIVATTSFKVNVLSNKDSSVLATHTFAPSTDLLTSVMIYDGLVDVSQIADYQYRVTTEAGGEAVDVKAFGLQVAYIISQQKWSETTLQQRRDAGQSSRDYGR